MATPEEIARLLMMQGYGPAPTPDPQAAAMAQALMGPQPADTFGDRYGSWQSNDPFEMAAQRTREAARPQGGRYEGALTKMLETGVPAMAGHVADTVAFPGRYMQGPETPGQWSEEDQFRADRRLQAAAGWGAPMATGMVFDPLALASKAPLGANLAPSKGLRQADAALPGQERIVAAAIPSADGRIFAGPMHIHAMDEARKVGADYSRILNPGYAVDGGFLTSKGRYISRQEAADVANKADQYNPHPEWLDVAKKRGVLAEALPLKGTSDAEYINRWQGQPLPDPDRGFTLGSFAGANAKTADHVALGRATAMAARGSTPEQIWKDTGWFQGTDKKWRFEIPDQGLALSDKLKGNLGQVAQHDQLFAAYPDLKDIPIKETKGTTSYYMPPKGGEHIGIAQDVPSFGYKERSLLHELQHAIQGREGFASGTNHRDGIPWWNRFPSSRTKEAAMDRYNSSPGEKEALLVERRYDFPSLQGMPPFPTGGFRGDTALSMISDALAVAPQNGSGGPILGSGAMGDKPDANAVARALMTPAKVSLKERRAANEKAFEHQRFLNKLAAVDGRPQEAVFNPPYPEAWAKRK